MIFLYDFRRDVPTFRPREHILDSVRPLGPLCFAAGKCFACVRQSKFSSRQSEGTKPAAGSQQAAGSSQQPVQQQPAALKKVEKKKKL